LYGFNLQILQQQLTKVVSPEQRYQILKKFEILAMRVHKLWKRLVEEERSRIIEEARSFEIKGRQLEMLEQDEQEERAFRSLFLGSLSIFEDIDLDEGDDGEKINEPDSFKNDQCLLERKEVSDMLLSRLFEIFTLISSPDLSEMINRQETMALEMNSRLLSGMEMIQEFGGSLPSSLDQFCIPGFLYTLSHEWNYLSGNVEDPVFNIYSRNIKEASRALEPVTNVLVKVDELLSEWPEHPILDQLKKIGTRILSLPLKSTLKDYSTGIELLLSRAQLWEETAAKHVSLSDLLKPLISIANSWRELELKSWKDSLSKVRREMIKEARESWFFMFGIITEDLDSFVNFVNTMDSFIQSSTIGQFGERIDILQKFGRYLEQWCPEHVLIDQKNLMANSLKNMAAYYAEYAPAVEKYITEGMKPLEKELSDFISLAKWEDRGFYAMKASKEKAYKQLHKITRKAKDLLSQSCSVCLRSEAHSIGIEKISNNGISSETESLLAVFQCHISSLPVTDQKLTEIPKHAGIGKYSGQIDRLSKKFRIITGDSSLLEKLHDISQRMHEISVVALKQSAMLKTDVSKGAKSRKKKALSDYFKYLEGCGISKLQSSIPHDAKDAHYWTRLVCRNSLL
jgi:midasin